MSSKPRANNDKNHKSDDDSEVIAQILAGEPQRFNELVYKHQQRIFRFLFGMLGNKEDAEDVTQECFVNAFRKLSSFERRSQFYTWLQRIARNLAISHRRKYAAKKSQTVQTDEQMEAELAGREQTGVENSRQKEAMQLIRSAITQLNDDRREVLVLRDIEELDYSTISERLEIPIGTVRSRLHRARCELKEILETFTGSLVS